MLENWKEKTKKLEDLLRLRGHPIAISFLRKVKDADNIPKVRKDDTMLTTCQRFTQARIFGFTTVETALNTLPSCSYIMGLVPVAKEISDGSVTTGIWCETQADARKRASAFPVIPFGDHEAMVISSLERVSLDPDVILVYGNPAQIALLINGFQWEPYQLVKGLVTGGSTCAVSVANCYLTREPSLALPDYGERRYGHVADDEVSIAFPAADLDKILIGLDALSKTGVSYPISVYGAQISAYNGMPASYRKLMDKQLEEARRRTT